MSRWTTPFGRWVHDYGVSELMKSMKDSGEPVTCGAIYAWVSGRAQPTPPKAKLLVKLADGALTLNDVYDQPKAPEPAPAPERIVQERLEPISVAATPRRT